MIPVYLPVWLYWSGVVLGSLLGVCVSAVLLYVGVLVLWVGVSLVVPLVWDDLFGSR